MCRKTRSFGIGIILVLVGTMSSGAALAESPSVLLEKAIYEEETVGNLDAAAKLYRRTIEEAKQVDAVAAKAQYRLGLCLLKQGKKEEGVAALQEVVRRFSEQKEIVAEARKHLPSEPGLKLLPVPWVDGETQHQRMELGGGLELGTAIYSVQKAELDGQKIWRFRSRVFAFGRGSASCVDVRQDNLQPIRSVWNIGGVSSTIAQYNGNKITVTTKTAGKETQRTIDVQSAPYDNEEGAFLFRCLPMTKGHNTNVPIFASIGNSQAIDIGFQPQGQESVSTPAGQFQCEKVLLPTPINQTFWYSTDRRRYFVKFEANNIVGLLTKIETRKPGESQAYENADLGVSLCLSPDWHAYASAQTKDNLWLLDPDAVFATGLKSYKLAKLSADEKKSPRAWAEKWLIDAGKREKQWRVRPKSWRSMTISGEKAVEFAADFTATDGREMVRFVVCLFGKTRAVRLAADGPRGELERMKKAILPMVESLKVK
ncbi:MAG: tetratricopeptide repeat protein [Thermoguttaceae bacterium]